MIFQGNANSTHTHTHTHTQSASFGLVLWDDMDRRRNMLWQYNGSSFCRASKVAW